MSQDAAITCSEPPQRCAEKSWGYEAVVLSCLHSFAVRLGTLWAQTTRRIRFSLSSERRRGHHVVIILPSGRPPLLRKRYPPPRASEPPRSGTVLSGGQTYSSTRAYPAAAARAPAGAPLLGRPGGGLSGPG